MSKHILIVDLPDEVYCHGCKCLDESAEHCNASGKDLFDSVVYQFNNTIFPRPADCPLIPVDEMLAAIESHKVLAPGGSHDDGVATAIWVTKAALGVTE